MTSAAAPPRQLALDLGCRPALGAEDFLLSAANAQAVEAVDKWPDWPTAALLVAGSAQSGKSHLVNVWRVRSQAVRLAAADLDDGAIALLEQSGALAVEDLDRGIGDEKVLFHLLNLAREHGHSVLLTSRLLPGALAVSLPDLASRLRALPVASIAEPDEALLAAVLVKLFSDRQLQVEPHVIGYISRHMDRSMAAAAALVAEVDARSLERKRPVTRIIAAEVLQELQAHTPGTPQRG